MSVSLYKIVEPWLDEEAFDGLSDDEANERSDELEDKTGMGLPLREDAPDDVKQAYNSLVEEHQEQINSGVLVD